MSKEYILTACEPIPESVAGLKGHPMALNIPYPKYKQITLTEVELKAIVTLLKESDGRDCDGEKFFGFSEYCDLLDKLNMFVDDKPLDLRDCKAQIDPEYKARHDE